MSMVLPESRDRGSFTSPRRHGVSSISGSRRCLLYRFARFTVGHTISSGPGTWWTMYPSQQRPSSVAPICDPLANTTSWKGDDAESASMIFLRYGVRDVRHLPGSEAALPDSHR